MVKASVESAESADLTVASRPAAKPAGNLRWQPLLQACTDATPMLTEVFKQFWGVPVRLSFFCISPKNHYFWRLDDFHVSQLMLGEAPADGSEPPTALLRVSDTACAALLARGLGPRPGAGRQFSFKQLSPLEATILNEFSRDLLAACMKNLVRKPGAGASNARQLHLMWAVQIDEPVEPVVSVSTPGPARKQALQFKAGHEVGKLILSVPLSALRLPSATQLEAESTEIPDEFFFHVTDALAEPVHITLGITRMALSDLNQLEHGDLVVLEHSHSDRMALVEPLSGEQFPFQAEIRHKQQITIPYMQELDMMDTQQPVSTRQSLWDNLMIEVTAEFEPMKLPLKQIKQMSEGLVIEMGDLVHNSIHLQVDGKTLAQGELIVVGDKFGVRISRVEASDAAEGGHHAEGTAHDGGHQVAIQPPALQAAEQPQTQDENAADDENLDNFLNDDFDDNFDEDWDDWKEGES